MVTVLSSSEQHRLLHALEAVCAVAGLDPSDAHLLRYTMNAVYRLETSRPPTRREQVQDDPASLARSNDGVVVRMTTGPHAVELTTLVARVAASMAVLGLPTVRLWPGVGQPVHAEDWSATIWTLLPQNPSQRFTPIDLAQPLRALHAVQPHLLDLPAWDTLKRIEHRLSRVEAMQGQGALFLRQWATNAVGVPLDPLLQQLHSRAHHLAEALSAAKWTRPWGLIHGDAHTGNLLTDRAGRVVLCDLDSVAYGPPEWDLVPAAHGALRFGDDPSLHTALAEAYGLDVTACPAWETLRDIRELQLVTSVIGDLPGRPDVAKELANRLTTVITRDHTARWNRYR